MPTKAKNQTKQSNVILIKPIVIAVIMVSVAIVYTKLKGNQPIPIKQIPGFHILARETRYKSFDFEIA